MYTIDKNDNVVYNREVNFKRKEYMNKESKQVELVYELLSKVNNMIKLVYKPDDVEYCNAKYITDEKIKEYYYQINQMCCELLDRHVMLWQQEIEEKNETKE